MQLLQVLEASEAADFIVAFIFTTFIFIGISSSSWLASQVVRD